MIWLGVAGMSTVVSATEHGITILDSPFYLCPGMGAVNGSFGSQWTFGETIVTVQYLLGRFQTTPQKLD